MAIILLLPHMVVEVTGLSKVFLAHVITVRRSLGLESDFRLSLKCLMGDCGPRLELLELPATWYLCVHFALTARASLTVVFV